MTGVATPTGLVAATPAAALVAGYYAAAGLLIDVRVAAAVTEKLVAQESTAEAAEQTAPEATAAATVVAGTAVSGPIARSVSRTAAHGRSARAGRATAIVARARSRTHDRTNDKKSDDDDQDPPEHRNMYS